MSETNEIERSEIQSIASAYDTKKVKIGIFGSHSALPTGYAAKRAGLMTVLLVKSGRLPIHRVNSPPRSNDLSQSQCKSTTPGPKISPHATRFGDALPDKRNVICMIHTDILSLGAMTGKPGVHPHTRLKVPQSWAFVVHQELTPMRKVTTLFSQKYLR